MIRKDYLQKQIDQLGEALSKLLGEMLKLKSQGKEQESTFLANSELKKALDIDFTDKASFAKENFVKFLVDDKQVDYDNLNNLALILYETTFNEVDIDKKKIQLTQLLELFKYLELNDKDYSFDRYLKIEMVQKELEICR